MSSLTRKNRVTGPESDKSSSLTRKNRVTGVESVNMSSLTRKNRVTGVESVKSSSLTRKNRVTGVESDRSSSLTPNNRFNTHGRPPPAPVRSDFIDFEHTTPHRPPDPHHTHIRDLTVLAYSEGLMSVAFLNALEK